MKLPVVLVVPHTGTLVPTPLQSLCALTPQQLQQDPDPQADKIFDLRAEVLDVVTGTIARSVIDVDRHQHDRSMDGVTKLYTRHFAQVFRGPVEPNLMHSEIERHYKQFHQAVSEALTEDVQLGIDCHTVAASAPPMAHDKGTIRPEVCLGNLYGETLPEDWMADCVKCFKEQFEEVTVNDPNPGAFIADFYGQSVPWLHVSLRVDSTARHYELREQFFLALAKFCERFQED